MFKKIQALIKGGKGGYEMLVPKIKKDLKKRRETKEDKFKSVDEKAGKNIGISEKSKIKKDAGKKVSDIYDKYEKAITGKAKGGRIGLKKGTDLPKKKSNVDKIKKTFGTLSVRAGIDKNPNATYADKIAGAKMKNKNKKKVI